MMTTTLNAVLAALFVYLSFPNIWNAYGFWPLAWFSVIALMMAMEGQSPIRRLGIGILFGLVLYGSLLVWLFPVHFFGAVAFILAMSIQPVLFSAFYSRAITRPLVDPQSSPARTMAAVVFVPALWTASEYVRTMILGGFAWGLGYSQSFHPALIQFAAAAGPYGVSFVIILVNILLYRSLRMRDRSALAAAVLLMVVLYASGQWRSSMPESGNPIITVCAVQPNIPPHKKSSDQNFDDNIRLHEDLTVASASGQKPDVIVWPETAFPADIFKDRFWYPRFGNIASKNNALFVFGAVPVVDGKNYNSAVLLDERGSLAGVYDKQFLVPLSELKPGGILKLFRPWFEGYGFDGSTRPERVLQDESKGSLTTGPRGRTTLSEGAKRLSRRVLTMKDESNVSLFGSSFSPGDKLGLFSNRDGKIRFGMMICSESCYPSLARQLSNSQASWMIAILNDGWFLRPEAIMLHAQNAVFRAVESGRDIVSVGNTGWTGVINAYGVMRHDQQLPLQRKEQGVFQVSSRHKQTLYSKIGDFFAGACGLFVIMHLIFQYRIRKQS